MTIIIIIGSVDCWVNENTKWVYNTRAGTGSMDLMAGWCAYRLQNSNKLVLSQQL